MYEDLLIGYRDIRKIIETRRRSTPRKSVKVDYIDEVMDELEINLSKLELCLNELETHSNSINIERSNKIQCLHEKAIDVEQRLRNFF